MQCHKFHSTESIASMQNSTGNTVKLISEKLIIPLNVMTNFDATNQAKSQYLFKSVYLPFCVHLNMH